jgi:hypothetical protein
MQPPTASDVRSWSSLDFADPELGYAAPAGNDPDPLQFIVDQSVAYVTLVTGRSYDDTVPALIVPLMNQAARMRTEQVVMQSRADTVETAGDIDMVSSFTAGSYSETRKDTERRGEQRSLNPWPALNDLLWLLMTLAPGETNALVDAMRDYWRFILGMSPNPPAWSLVEVAWRENQGPSYGFFPLTGFDAGLYGGGGEGYGYHNPY